MKNLPYIINEDQILCVINAVKNNFTNSNSFFAIPSTYVLGHLTIPQINLLYNSYIENLLKYFIVPYYQTCQLFISLDIINNGSNKVNNLSLYLRGDSQYVSYYWVDGFLLQLLAYSTTGFFDPHTDKTLTTNGKFKFITLNYSGLANGYTVIEIYPFTNTYLYCVNGTIYKDTFDNIKDKTTMLFKLSYTGVLTDHYIITTYNDNTLGFTAVYDSNTHSYNNFVSMSNSPTIWSYNNQ